MPVKKSNFEYIEGEYGSPTRLVMTIRYIYCNLQKDNKISGSLKPAIIDILKTVKSEHGKLLYSDRKITESLNAVYDDVVNIYAD